MSKGDDNLYDEEMVPIVFDRPAKPPKPQSPKPPAPPPPPMVEEALALIERPPPEEHEMNQLTGLLPVWLRDRETPDFAPANTPPPPDPCSDTAAVGETMGGRGERTTGALGEVIRHCFGNYAQWRKIHQSPE